MPQKTILCFGDSNTHGTMALRHLGDVRRFPKELRWPTIMSETLGEDVDVIVDGLPARTSAFDDPVDGEHKNGLRVLPSVLQANRPVDVLIIMLGTNDLKVRFSLPAIDIALGLENLAIATRTFGVSSDGGSPKILFVCPVPIKEIGFLGEIFEGGSEKSKRLAGYLGPVAQRQGAAFLDLSSVAEVDETDGIHLTAEGQIAIGHAIAKAVQDLLISS